MTEPAPIDPLQVRLDLIRGDVLIQLEVMAMLVDIAKLYVGMRDDERLVGAMHDAKDRFRLALGRTADLQRERADSALNGAAAEEWRATRRA